MFELVKKIFVANRENAVPEQKKNVFASIRNKLGSSPVVSTLFEPLPEPKGYVWLLIDESESMSGEDFQLAKKGAFVFASEAIRRSYAVGIIFFITSFLPVTKPVIDANNIKNLLITKKKGERDEANRYDVNSFGLCLHNSTNGTHLYPALNFAMLDLIVENRSGYKCIAVASDWELDDEFKLGVLENKDLKKRYPDGCPKEWPSLAVAWSSFYDLNKKVLELKNRNTDFIAIEYGGTKRGDIPPLFRTDKQVAAVNVTIDQRIANAAKLLP